MIVLYFIRYCIIEATTRIKWLGQDIVARATGFSSHADYIQHMLDIRARIRENTFD